MREGVHDDAAAACPPTLVGPEAEPADVIARDYAGFDQRFRVERVLGTGAMGIVVAAHHRALDARVAIKLMRPELRTRGALVERFLREARSAARLTSPHATRVHDVGALDDGAPYIVMEYLEGRDLARELADGPLPVARAALLIGQACAAIAEAHRLGIVHRDLKPANLFVTRGEHGEPWLKVLDLGTCRLLDGADLRETALETLVGTPLYTAPEQLRAARDADARSDVWSLGVVLFELVSGRVPFLGVSPADQCLRATLERYPHLPDVPRAFDHLVARCLAKSPADRFQNAGELAAALQPFAAPAPRRRPVTLAITAAALAAVAALWAATRSPDIATPMPPAATASPPAATASPPAATASPPTATASPPAATASPPTATASPPTATASPPTATATASPPAVTATASPPAATATASPPTATAARRKTPPLPPRVSPTRTPSPDPAPPAAPPPPLDPLATPN